MGVSRGILGVETMAHLKLHGLSLLCVLDPVTSLYSTQ